MSRSCSSASGCSDALRQASRKGASAARVIALLEERAGERELASLRDRLVAGEGANGREVRVLLPQHHLGAAAEHPEARPARIGGDEGLIAREIRGVVVAAQDRPFDELAGDRIGDAALEVGRVRGLAAAGEREGVVGGGEVGGGRGDRRRRQRLAGRLGGIERGVNGAGRQRLPARCDRSRVVALPGHCSLCWAMICGRGRGRGMCLVTVTASACAAASPAYRPPQRHSTRARRPPRRRRTPIDYGDAGSNAPPSG